MPKYSFRTKSSKEIIKSVNRSNIEDAISYFAKIKVLQTEQFLKIYEVIER
jgi:hypothetical protein